MVAASIRYNNPGAMWGNALATKWGAQPKGVVLNDGLGQGNNIAVFPTKVQGACAQFALWQQGYCNMSLQAAIKKWSGGNSSEAYMKFLEQASGIGATDTITPQVLASRSGLLLIKAQARWEAGGPYPLSDADWTQAQAAVFRGIKPKLPMTTTQKKITATVVAAGGAAGAVVHVGLGHDVKMLFIGFMVAAVVGAGAWLYFHFKG